MQNIEDKKIKKIGANTGVPDVKLRGARKIRVEIERSATESVKKPKPAIENQSANYSKPLTKPKSLTVEAEEKKEKIVEVKETKKITERSEAQPRQEIAEIKKESEKKETVKNNNPRKKVKFSLSAIRKFFEFFERPKLYKGVSIALVFISVFMIAVAIFVIRPIFNNDGIPSLVTVVYNFDSVSKTNYDGEYVFKNGSDQVYVNLSDVSEHISLMAMGDSKNMRFYKKDGTYMSVEKDSRYVIINGIEVILPSPVIFDGKEVFVPAELFQYYTTGISVDYNIYRERLTLSFVKNKDESTTVNAVYEEFKFLPALPEAIEPISEPET